MNAVDIMTRSVVAVGPDAPLAQAVRLMIDRRISGLPVIDSQGMPVGIPTEGDLLRRVEAGTEGAAPGWFTSFFTPGRLAAQYVRTHGRRVAEVRRPTWSPSRRARPSPRSSL
jgi:CBS-domain-containing membrane protein